MFRKALSVLVSVLAITALLTGCADRSDASQQPSAEPTLQATDNLGSDLGGAVEDAGDAVGDVADGAGDVVDGAGAAVEDAGDAVDGAAKE